MTTSVAPDVADYLVAQCEASPLLGAAAPPVTIFDGPHLSQDQLAAGQRMWIGFDPFAGQAPMESVQDFAAMGDMARARNETGHVICAAEDWSGDTAMKPHRDAVKNLIGVVELMLRGRPDLGGPGDYSMGGLVLWAQVTDTAWYQGQPADGASCACVFKVGYQARLTT